MTRKLKRSDDFTPEPLAPVSEFRKQLMDDLLAKDRRQQVKEEAVVELRNDLVRSLNRVIGSYSYDSFKAQAALLDVGVVEKLVSALLLSALEWCQANGADFDQLLVKVRKEVSER